MLLNNKLSPIERAIYASLCGNIQQVLPQCQQWEDFVWIFFKSQVETTIDLLLAKNLVIKQWDYENDAQKSYNEEMH